MGKERTFIDLFCGAGGMSYGFEMAGFKPVLAVDNWQDALDTYKHNNPNGTTLCADLSAIDVKQVAKDFNLKNVDLIIGGPPCQGFSDDYVFCGKRGDKHLQIGNAVPTYLSRAIKESVKGYLKGEEIDGLPTEFVDDPTLF